MSQSIAGLNQYQAAAFLQGRSGLRQAAPVDAFQRLLETVAERQEIAPSPPNGTPALGTVKPKSKLAAMTNEELAAYAGIQLASPEELASRGMTPEKLHETLYQQAVAAQGSRWGEQARNYLETKLGVPKDVGVMMDDNAGAAIAAMMMRDGIEPPDDAVFRPGPGRAEITLLTPGGQVRGRISFDMKGADTMEAVNDWLDRVAAGFEPFNLSVFSENPMRDGAMTGSVAHHLRRALTEDATAVSA